MSARNAEYAPSHVVAQKGPVGARSSFFGSDPAPSIGFLGSGLQDHRLPYNMYSGQNAATAVGILGWYGDEPSCISQAPAAIVAGNISAAANAVTGVAAVLAGASTGISVVPANTLFYPSMQVISGGLALDGLPALVRFGRRFITAFYDRTTFISRAISVTGVVGGTGGTFVVKGFDVYGFPMTQNLVATAGATTVTSLKAFKIVSSITPQFTDPHTYAFQTADVIGLPILTKKFEDVFASFNNTTISASTGFLPAVTTSPATALTGDVRGTYALQAASDGVKRLAIQISPSLLDIAADPTTGLFGQTQF